MPLLTASGVHSNFEPDSNLFDAMSRFLLDEQHWKKENINIYVQTIYLVTYVATYFNIILIATFPVHARIIVDASKVWALPLPLGTGGHL